jgi:hypothetical protein
MDFRNKFNSVMNRSKANIYMVVLTAFLVLLLSGCGIPGQERKCFVYTRNLRSAGPVTLEYCPRWPRVIIKNPSVDIIYYFCLFRTLQKQI